MYWKVLAPKIDPDAFYYIINKGTKAAMDATGCMGGGCEVYANKKQALKGQLWQFKPVSGSSGVYTIVNVLTAKCLNDPNWSSDAGTQMILWGECKPDSAGDNERFIVTWVSSGADQGWQIKQKYNEMTIDSTNSANGAKVQINSDNKIANQRWSFESIC